MTTTNQHGYSLRKDVNIPKTMVRRLPVNKLSGRPLFILRFQSSQSLLRFSHLHRKKGGGVLVLHS
jgi:hypothetical protein